MQKLIFTTLAIPGRSEQETLLMTESIRSFGGDLAASPIWVLVPKAMRPLSISNQERLEQLRVKIISFDVSPEISNFPLATKILAAAVAEEQSKGKTERIAFMDHDTLVIQEPSELLIAANKSLGYRPVHHKLIGSTWEKEIDSFWKLIFDVCHVNVEHLFPMTSHAGEKIRPYFNAGMFVLRPEKGLLAQWKEIFLKWYRQPEFGTYYEKDQLYAIFIHQAIFSGVILKNLRLKDMQELSPKINYPLHLHGEIPENQCPQIINEMITVRYENVFDQPDWQNLPITDPLKSWIKNQLKLQKYPDNSPKNLR